MSHSKDNWTVDWETYGVVEVGVCRSAGTALYRSVDEVVKQTMVEA